MIKDIYYYLKYLLRGKRESCPRCGHKPFVHGHHPKQETYCVHCGLWKDKPITKCPRCKGQLVKKEYELPMPVVGTDGLMTGEIMTLPDVGMYCKKCDVVW